MELREPDWAHARHLDSWPLWKLVALLARIEPDDIGADFRGLCVEFEDCTPPEYFKLLEIATQSVVATTLLTITGHIWPDNPEDNYRSNVGVVHFLAWAKNKKLPIPPEMEPMVPGPTGMQPRVVDTQANDYVAGWENIVSVFNHAIGYEIQNKEKRKFLQGIFTKHGVVVERVGMRGTGVRVLRSEILRAAVAFKASSAAPTPSPTSDSSAPTSNRAASASKKQMI